ncbi:hypothetical protein L6164_003003 [Bauhinia variegata]|uniref:Uncharacterized protein n=1 Tax=Bauhinia variegata TaxID=167791 RepID=A0ACB9PZ36_BAUVA|nr:hypothetical protein L6164_003003 [Bauhinia variegata]
MKGGLITFILILAFASPHSCVGLNPKTKDTFNVMDYGAVGDGKSDDSQAISKAWNDACGAVTPGTATLVFPQGKTFYLKPMDFQGPCKSKYINIQIQGNILAPTKAAWGSKDRYIGFLYINGLSIYGGGAINGQGSSWWKECTGSCQRPTLMCIHNCHDVTVNGLRNIDSPRNHMSIYLCNGVRISDLHIQAPGESPGTDGINIALSANVNIESSSIASGDDCISMINGTSFVNISGIACGPGHGISIGSLGSSTSSSDTVREVHVRNCSFTGTENGVRIKTFQDRVGYVGKVTFEELTMIAPHNPIIIDQHYFSKVKETGAVAVNVSDITFRGIHGTCADEKAIELNCNKKFGCQNLILDNINLTSSVPGKKTIASCFNAHGVATSVIPSNPCLQK